jgi:hypothetical protein
MSWDQIPLVGVQPATEWTVTQFVIPAGAGATFSATNNIATITTNAAHGLTMNPAAGVLPNYYVTFAGTTSGLSGTGILVGNIFRILSIPSTTTFTIYTTITAATITSMTTIPVFYPSFQLSAANVGGQPYMGAAATPTYYPFPALGGCMVNVTAAANLVAYYAPNTSTAGTLAIPLDGTTTTQLGGTPATAPTLRIVGAASTDYQIEMAYPWSMFQASGTTATSYISVLR